MKNWILFSLILAATVCNAQQAKISEETEACLDCHKSMTPGIVLAWQKSLHAKTTPAQALQKSVLERRVSADKFKDSQAEVVVGCYECHAQNPEKHQDSFSHFDHKIHLTVTPNDCAACHPVEAQQYGASKKAHAAGNLSKNPVYHTLVKTVTGLATVKDGTITVSPPSDFTRQETCFACHGTEIKVQGMKVIDTALGALEIPDLTGWPNSGVGRLNPDGSRGFCASCHSQHSFSIETARKPHTCGQCHLEPDVPAYNVYQESKHGNLFDSHNREWNFQAVPWKVGSDFAAPTCATCHNSLLVTPDGETVAPRTHDFGSRLWVRIFGLIYSHPQPKTGDTSIIRNQDGLPLPVTFDGKIAGDYLISPDEQKQRQAGMQAICKSCHSTDWTMQHFAKFDNTVRETDGMTLAATRLMQHAWTAGIADKSNPFDEPLEQLWISQWLFYANSVRYASAMTGAPDYAAFKYGWWGMTTNLRKMQETIELHQQLRKK